MVNYTSFNSASQMDHIFKALADPTRRNILERLTTHELTVTQIARSYDMSLPAVSKHLTVLEKAKLVRKSKSGREHKVYFEPKAMKTVAEYIAFYKKYWNRELDHLEKFLAKEVKEPEKERA